MSLYKVSLRGSMDELSDAMNWCRDSDIACVTMPNIVLAARMPVSRNTFARCEFIFEDEKDASMFLLGFGGEIKEMKNGSR